MGYGNQATPEYWINKHEEECNELRKLLKDTSCPVDIQKIREEQINRLQQEISLLHRQLQK